MRCVNAGIMSLVIAVGAPPTATGDVLDDIAAAGAITLGYREDAPPFSYLSELGEPEGLAVDLCRTAAGKVREVLALPSLAVSYQSVTAADRFDALTEGRIHLLCGPTTQTLSRREVIDFSVPYFIDGSSAVFRAGPVEAVDDLAGQPVGSLKGTTTEAIVTQLSAERSLNLIEITYPTHVAGLKALEEGEISAYFGDQAILRYQLGQLRPVVPLQFAESQFSFEPYALAMKRGETRLRLAVDRALSETFSSGAIYTIINASLGEVTLSDLALAVYQIVALPE